MATYATYRHVELDGIGRGKRRVTKPPGGGSSIQFEEEGSPLPHYASNRSSPSPPSTPPSPAEPAKIINGSSPPPSPDQKTLSNGTPPKVSSEQVTINKSTDVVDQKVTQSPQVEAKPDIIKVVETKVSAIDLKSEETSKVVEKQQTVSCVTTNGHNGSHSSGSSTPSNPSPVPSAPSSPTDRTCRMSLEGRPRIVRDHMRSNIFMSDEEYTPTRSSRVNAATINDDGAAAAGQRYRQPPGGFASKLW